MEEEEEEVDGTVIPTEGVMCLNSLVIAGEVSALGTEEVVTQLVTEPLSPTTTGKGTVTTSGVSSRRNLHLRIDSVFRVKN